MTAIPKCMRCKKARLLYGGICDSCHAAEDREENDRG